jgi:hypothetical protein
VRLQLVARQPVECRIFGSDPSRAGLRLLPFTDRNKHAGRRIHKVREGEALAFQACFSQATATHCYTHWRLCSAETPNQCPS